MVEPLELLGKGIILGIPLAVLPGPFVDTLITEARRRTYGSCLSILLIRAAIEGPCFVLLAIAVSFGARGWMLSWEGFAFSALLFGLWGWHLIDRTSYLSLRMDASYGRLHSSPKHGALSQLLSRFWRSPWWWVLWVCSGLRIAAELDAGGLQAGTGWLPLFWPMQWWLRLGSFALGYFIPAIVGALWVAYSLSHRARLRQGDFFLLPNRPYRIVVSIGGMFLLFLGFAYGMDLLSMVVDFTATAGS